MKGGKKKNAKSKDKKKRAQTKSSTALAPDSAQDPVTVEPTVELPETKPTSPPDSTKAVPSPRALPVTVLCTENQKEVMEHPVVVTPTQVGPSEVKKLPEMVTFPPVEMNLKHEPPHPRSGQGLLISSLLDTLYIEKPKLKQVKVGTDLGEPPTNYFRFEQNWNPRVFSHKLPTGFSSFAVAQGLEHLVGVTDFVSDAENIKHLIKLPFSKESISLLMHRIGKSILVDNYDLSRLFLNNKEKDPWEWFAEYAKAQVQNKRDALYWEGRSGEQIQAQNTLHRLFYYSLKEDLKFKCEKVKNSLNTNCLRQPPESTLNGSRTKFLQKLTWEFSEFSFLLGSDVPAFQSIESTSTLREKKPWQLDVYLLWPITNKRPVAMGNTNDITVSKTLTVLDCVDSWLDNLMLNALDTFLCHHEDSVVLRTEFIKTEDLTSGSFQPNFVVERSKKLLSVIKSVVCEAGHSYWFYKAPGEDVFEIYNLTRISQASAAPTVVNPIIPSIGTLLYRICETSSCVMPPATVLTMMRHFVSIYSEEEYPLLAISAIYMVLNSRLNLRMDVYRPKIRLLNGEKTEVNFSYNWKSEREDIFDLEFLEDTTSQCDIQIFNEFQEAMDYDIWTKIVDGDLCHTKPISKKASATKKPNSIPLNAIHLRVPPTRSILLCQFFPANICAPQTIKTIQRILGIYRNRDKDYKRTPNCLNISTFSCHNAAYTQPIQKPFMNNESSTTLSYRKEESLSKRVKFFKTLKDKCDLGSFKSVSDPAIPKPTEWIFYLTCKQLFRLFSSAFCLIDEVSACRVKEATGKKAKQAEYQRGEQQKHDLNTIFREKLALLFLCIAYFAYTRTPSQTLLGRFCAKWAIFLYGEHKTRAEVLSSAWKMAGDLLAATLGSGHCETEISSKSEDFEVTALKAHQDLIFLCKMSQGTRNIRMVNYLKQYDNYKQKTTFTLASWLRMSYNKSLESTPDRLIEFVLKEISNSLGQAAIDYFKSTQEHILMCEPTSFQNITEVKDLRKALSNRMVDIMDYFDMAREFTEKYEHGNNLMQSIKMMVFRAEVQLLQEVKLTSLDSIDPDKVQGESREKFSKVLLEETNKINRTDKFIPNTIHDEISWRIACNELEIANFMYRSPGLRKTCKIGTSEMGDYYNGIFTHLDQTEILVNQSRCFPSLGRQKVLLANIYERRAIVNYSLARIYGWQPDHDLLQEQSKTKSIYGKDICLSTKYFTYKEPYEREKDKYKIGHTPDPNRNPNTFLKKAEDAFLVEVKIYSELGCAVELTQAYLCFVDCRMGIVDKTNRKQTELSLMCGIEDYLPLYRLTKTQGGVKFITDSAYNTPTVIGTLLSNEFRINESDTEKQSVNPIEMLEIVSRRFWKCLATVSKEVDILKSGNDCLLDSVESLVEILVRDKEKEITAELLEERIMHLKFNIQEVRRIILHGNPEIDTLFCLDDNGNATQNGIRMEYTPSRQDRGAGGDGPLVVGRGKANHKK